MFKLFSVSSKIVLTAILSLALLVIGLVAYPEGLQMLLNAAKDVQTWLPEATELPIEDSGGKFLYDLVVDEQAIFGILLTLIARILVELLWGLFSMAFKSGKG